MTAARLPAGPPWEAIKTFALRLSDRSVTELPVGEAPELSPYLAALLGAGVLVKRGDTVRFFHETMYDHVLARAFVEAQRSLISDVLEQRQDLSLRPLIRQILSFQRGVDRAVYQASVRDLLTSDAVRFHLRDVVFDVLREDPDPAEPEWEILEPLVLDEHSIGAQAAWSVVIQPAWLRLVDRSGVLLRWMASESSADQDRATSLLRHVNRNDPDRAAVLLLPFLGFGATWHQRIRWVISSRAGSGSPRSVEFLIDALNAGVFDGRNDEALWLAVHGMPSEHPRWAEALLRAYLERVAARAPVEDSFGLMPRREYEAEQFVRSLARRDPLAFVRGALPSIARIVEATVQGSGDQQDDPFRLRYSTRGHDFKDALYESLDSALRELATRRPKSFGRWARFLADRAQHESLRSLLYRGWAANPEAFWRPALDHLVASEDPFHAGYIDSPYWITRELIQAIQTEASRESLAPLVEKLLGFYSDWERHSGGHQQRGLAQYTLLDAFADRQLTEDARRRRQELARKFGSAEHQAPRGIRVGRVDSPIPDDRADKMTDRSWLQAIRRYNTDEGSGRDFLKGGAIELSRVLERQAKEDPERFATLAVRFPDDVNDAYVDAILRGLGDTETPISAESVAEVLRRFFTLPSRPGGRWISKPLARVTEQRVPEDVLDIVGWYATEADDPAGPWHAPPDDDDEATGFTRDAFTAGINTVRGSAAEAVSVLIWPDAARLQHFLPALDRLAHDKSIAVRACAAVAVRAAYRHDPAAAVALFTDLCEAEDALLGTRPVEDFLALASKSYLSEIKPILARMLSSASKAVRSAGGRQVALAALDSEEASDLLQRAFNGPADVRLGVAQVAAHNIANPDVGDTCATWLPPLFNDPEKAVRDEASDWTRQLGPTGIFARRELAHEYITSRAYGDDEFHLLHALDDSTVSVVDIALPALQTFVERRRSEMGDIARSSSLAASIASKLAVRAYASATSDTDREAALDVIDALLAAKVSEIRTFVDSYESDASAASRL